MVNEEENKRFYTFFLTIACHNIVLTFTQNDLNMDWRRKGLSKSERNIFKRRFQLEIYFKNIFKKLHTNIQMKM